MVGISEKIELAPARYTLKIVLEDICRPQRSSRDLFQAACPLEQSDAACSKKPDNLVFQAMILFRSGDLDRHANIIAMFAHKNAF